MNKEKFVGFVLALNISLIITFNFFFFAFTNACSYGDYSPNYAIGVVSSIFIFANILGLIRKNEKQNNTLSRHRTKR